MIAREWYGYWWLPEAPEARQAGILNVDHNGKTTLRLIGGFDLRILHESGGGWAFAGEIQNPSLIHGECEGRPFSLLDCLVTSETTLFGPPDRQQLLVQRTLSGVHVTDKDAPEFVSGLFQIENLTTWLQLPHSRLSGSANGDEYAATLRRPSTVRAEFDGWVIETDTTLHAFRLNPTRASHLVTGDVTAHLRITAPEARPLGDFDRIVHELTDLLTLASGEAAGLIEFRLHHVSERVIQLPDEELALPITVDVFGERIHSAAPDAPATDRHRFRFTCTDMAFADIVPRWLSLRRKAASACNVFFSLKYAPPGYTDTRLLLNAVAAESLHSSLFGDVTDKSRAEFTRLREKAMAALDDVADRAWLKANLHNRPSFRRRLRKLASVPSAEAVALIIADVERWAGDLVGARNGLAHEGNGRSGDLFRLEWLTTGLLTLIFMAELGLSGEVQTRAAHDNLRLTF
jgi:hypothetical protein